MTTITAFSSMCFLVVWTASAQADDWRVPIEQFVDLPRIKAVTALTEAEIKKQRLEIYATEVERRDALKAKLKSAQDLRDLAAKDFDPPGLGDQRFESRDQRVAKVAAFRRTAVDRLMNLPFEQNILRIHNGSALNTLNGCIGAAALQHEVFLRKIDGMETSQLSEQDRSTKQLIEKIAEDTYVSVQYLKSVRCKTSDGVPVLLEYDPSKEVDKIEYTTLPLNWPIWFELFADKRLSHLQGRVEDSRNALLQETDPKKRTEKRLELINSVGFLKDEFQIAFKRFAMDRRGADSNPQEMRFLHEAKRFVESLSTNVYEVAREEQFGSNPDHFKFNEYLREKNGEVSIITLLAMMEERGLSFADARDRPETKRATEEIFKSMRSYFYGLYAIEQTVKNAEQDVEESLRRIEHLEEVEKLNLQFDLARLAVEAMTLAAESE